MNIKELKSAIGAVDSADGNIERWENLRGREVAVIPTDSDYFKSFVKWKEANRKTSYDGKIESAPLYVSDYSLVDSQIKRIVDWAQPFRDKLASVLGNENE